MSYRGVGNYSPVLIQETAFAAALNYTSPTFGAKEFRALTFDMYLTTTDAAVQPKLTLTGLGANYANQIIFAAAAAAASGFRDGATTYWNTGILTSGVLYGRVQIAAGLLRGFMGQAHSGGTAFTISCVNGDTVNEPTGFVMTFNSASTGRIELWGVPS